MSGCVLRRASACSAFLAAGLFAATAEAQAVFDPDLAREGDFTRDRSISVRQRPRPEYASLPYRTGAFLVSPQVGVTAGLTDNVFSSERDLQEDFFLEVEPAFTVRSSWSRHGVEAFGQIRRREFAEVRSESTTDSALGAIGRYDIARGAALQAGASLERLTEPRTSPEAPDFATGPIRFDQRRLFAGGAWSVNRFRATGDAAFRQTRFDPESDPLGGDLLQEGRDRDTVVLTGRTEYAFSPAAAVTANLAVNDRDDPNRPAGAPDRGSNGYELLVGGDFDVGGLTRGRLALGYLSQNYDDPLLPDPSGVALEGAVEYFPTQLISLRANADRSVEDSVRAGGSSFIATNVSVQADYEVLRQFILSASTEWSRDTYKGIDRVNDRWTTAITATYLLNRSVGVSLSYQHIDQASEGRDPGRQFAVNRVLATVVRQFGIN